MAASPSPLTLIHGHCKFYIRDVELLPQILKAINTPVVQDTAPVIAELARASSIIMDAATQFTGNSQIRSIRDALFHTKSDIGRPLYRQIERLHQAFSFLRHVPACGIGQMAEDFRIALSRSSASADASSTCTPGMDVADEPT